MNQAYQNIEEGKPRYEEILSLIKELCKRWNGTHTKQSDPHLIADELRRIFSYATWISVDDIKPTFDLGLMGEYGENMGLNAETMYRWFKGNSACGRKEDLKNHVAYQKEDEIITDDQKRATMDSLIEIFMVYYDYYKENKQMKPGINHYVPVFWKWFKKLELIDISDDQENEMDEVESKYLRDLRSKVQGISELKETKNKLFIKAFKEVIDLGIDIEAQLKSI